MALSPLYQKLLERIQARMELEESLKDLETDIASNFRLSKLDAECVIKELSQKGLLRINGRKVRLP